MLKPDLAFQHGTSPRDDIFFRRILLTMYAGLMSLLVLQMLAEAIIYPEGNVARPALAAGLASIILLAESLKGLDRQQSIPYWLLRIALVEAFHAVFGDPLLTTFLYFPVLLAAHRTLSPRIVRGMVLAVSIQMVMRQGLFLTEVRADAQALTNGIIFSLILGVVGVLIFLLLKMSDEERSQRTKAENLLARLEAMHEQLLVLSATEERNRMARDIHDSLGHRLTSIHIQLEKALSYQEVNPEICRQAMHNAQQATHQALQDVRESVSALRHALPPDLRLQLSHLLEDARQTGLAVSFRFEGDERAYSPFILSTLYRCVQEGLTNIRRHAHAAQIVLEVNFEAHQVVMVLRDDGKGLAPEQSKTGFGLQGLSERVNIVGGSLRLESQPGQGTSLFITLPRNALSANRLYAEKQIGGEHAPRAGRTHSRAGGG